MEPGTVPINSIRLRPYAEAPLLTVLERIAHAGDREAMDELHSHRWPCRIRGRRLRILEYLQHLAEQREAQECCGHDAVALDQALDLAVDKFHNLPGSEDHGTNARYYIGACVELARRQCDHSGPLERERIAEAALQSMVARHFFLSCREARRRHRGWVSRYAWHVGGQTLWLWLPTDIAGSQRRQWLERHIPDVEPNRCGERHRVQEQIDRLCTHRQIHSLNDSDPLADGQNGLPWSLEYGLSVHGLSETVAQEKAATLEHQRRSIRELGSDRLAEMIRAIFEALADGQYRPADIARQFGLTRPTLSRFAGSTWMRSRDGRIPDLWANTAHVLSQHKPFREAVEAMGLDRSVTRAARGKERE